MDLVKADAIDSAQHQLSSYQQQTKTKAAEEAIKQILKDHAEETEKKEAIG